ncbi:MAG: protein kinase [Planctomycetota bacterium]
MPEAPAHLDSTIGKIVVDKGLATRQDVHDCLQEISQANEGSDPSQKTLGQLLVERGHITKAQLQRIRPELEEHSAGRQIPGYQILGKLGAGAMATVYQAKQLSLDRTVAVKVLPLKFSGDASFIQRFYDEGRAAAKLNHPNIVQAFDVGQAGEFHYFVMEYVDGRTVYDDIVKKGAYAEDQAIEIAMGVCKALVHAHAAGFIHRDVKPKNIMLSSDGITKLADMGLARAVTDREAAEKEAGKAYGTPYYISPEQIRGEIDVDPRADIYSLGATLYHMVTGKVPFDGPNPSSVMHRHLKDDLVPPDHVSQNISNGISEVIEFAMARNRSQRYASATDMLNDLKAVAQGEPPVVARKQFSLDALAELDDTTNAAATASLDEGPNELLAQPIFWFAAIGWVLAAALLLAVVILAASG